MQEIISFIKLLASSNTINFIIMLILLAYIVKKLNLTNTLDESISQVENSIKKSDITKAEALEKLNNAEDLMAHLPEDIKELEKNSSDKTLIFQNKIRENTQKSIYNIEKNIEHSIKIEEKKISNVMKDKTTKASLELAKQHITELLKANPELHNKYIMESLDELEKVKL